MPRVIPVEKLVALGQKPQGIRNVCIVAHVDHGKTTLADSLVAANGIISARMAGKLRYLDSTKDEQTRGITMKASSIALFWRPSAESGEEYLVNVVDSPGHIDFTGEVSTATQLADGCLIVVDVVEGVCPQTHSLLRQSIKEGLKPILVLNKVDRLVAELKMSPSEAYAQIQRCLTSVNAVAGEVVAAAVMEKDEEEVGAERRLRRESELDEELRQLDADEDALYFQPQNGNVVFASAFDGWGFTLESWVGLLSTKLGIGAAALRRCLWGDFFLDSKAKKIRPGAFDKGKRPLFVQLVLENVWAVYEAVTVAKDKAKIDKITASLGIKLAARDQRHQDPRVHLEALMSAWLPVVSAVLEAVVAHVPAPSTMSVARLERLCPKASQLPSPLRASLLSSSPSFPETLALVSKMVAVDRAHLPENRRQELSLDEMQRRRIEAKRRLQEKADSAATVEASSDKEAGKQVTFDAAPSAVATFDSAAPPGPPPDEFVFIGFSRVFAGTVRKGQKLLVLPSEEAEEGEAEAKEAVEVTVGVLYLLMGRDLEEVESVSAGNVCGIGGLESAVLRSATLSSTLDARPLCPAKKVGEAIVRVSVETEKPSLLPELTKGLKLLAQADPAARTLVDESGARVLVASGEVHLERCLSDLRERFCPKADPAARTLVDESGARVLVASGEVHLERCLSDLRERFCPKAGQLVVSAPIVPFQETIVKAPKLDQANELIMPTTSTEAAERVVACSAGGGQVAVTLEAFPLPPPFIAALEECQDVLDQPRPTKEKAEEMREALRSAWLSAWRSERSEAGSVWAQWRTEEDAAAAFRDHLWSFGPKKARLNVLLNGCGSGYRRRSLWSERFGLGEEEAEDAPDHLYHKSIVSGFHLRCAAGPLCDEPIRGLGIVVRSFEEDLPEDAAFSPILAGQVISSVKEAVRTAFQAHPQRILLAMYQSSIQATSEVLGRMYAVLSRRQGRVRGEELNEGTNLFTVNAVLPVVESFGFADEMRKRTSGLASPQLVFSHWELLDQDPFWVPSTEEELGQWGSVADAANRALGYVTAVRRRKGLFVQEKIVQHAEKQRTITRNK